MKSNTIVTVSDSHYIWGVFMMIASMRRNKMEEPVIVYAKGYDNRTKEIFFQFANVKIIDATNFTRSLTCSKPDAMLLADTDYITWVDGDAFFENNCSEAILPQSHEQIMIRKRSETEALKEKLSVRGKDGRVKIADFMTDVWQKDVGELDSPRLNTCCSACIISVSKKQKPFLDRWRAHMDKFLHTGDFGVVDTRNPAYFQTDESALNALLCFMRDAPQVEEEYRLNIKGTLFQHFIGKPKPWEWAKNALKNVDAYLDVVDYVLDSKLDLPAPLPFSLNRKNKIYFKPLAPIVNIMQKFENIGKIWRK